MKIAKLSHPEKDLEELLKQIYSENSMFSVTDRVMTIAYYTAKFRWSMKAFVALVRLLRMYNVPVGQHCNSESVGANMISVIRDGLSWKCRLC